MITGSLVLSDDDPLFRDRFLKDLVRLRVLLLRFFELVLSAVICVLLGQLDSFPKHFAHCDS